MGLDSPDRPFTGVMVTVWDDAGRPVDSKMTDGSGIAVFDALDAGEVGGSGRDYTFMVSKEGFEDKTDDINFPEASTKALTSTTVHIDVHQTAHALRVLRRIMKTTDKPGLECTRKHSAPSSTTFTGTTLGPILWQGEPGLLVFRDILWLAAGLGALIAGLAGFLAAPPGSPFLPGVIAIAGICLAYFGYFGGVIFGLPFGIPTILVACVAFIALTVVTIMSASAPAFMHLPPPDPWGFPILAGTWAGFGYGWLPQRHSAYNSRGWECLIHVFVICPLLSAATAALVSALLLGPAHADLSKNGDQAAGYVLVIVGGALFGGLAGLLGLCFVNEGQTKLKSDAFLTGFLLPYAGERYCVQGHRGFISHFFRRSRDPLWSPQDEETSYDWSLPQGARLLCVKEGHIVDFDDTQDGSTFKPPDPASLPSIHDDDRKLPKDKDQANYIAIRHFDGTTAKYLHLMTNGIIGDDWNSKLAERLSTINVESGFDPNNVSPNPLHVHTGQVIGGNGNIGISMFPHLHLYVQKAPPLKYRPPGTDDYDPPSDSHYAPFKFDDPDAQRHGGRCWSMRKYASSNADKGLLVVPDEQPPFNPGGSATNGDPVPGSPLAPSSSGSGSSSGGSGPTPPSPSPPGTPPVPGTSGTPPGTTPPVPPSP
ncbi:MAG TPA: hypothetical protein VK335_24515 [Bryobacteraceae bacterium]|nr:hypothetical protein [Bryobacteraceae bacterium]